MGWGVWFRLFGVWWFLSDSVYLLDWWLTKFTCLLGFAWCGVTQVLGV